QAESGARLALVKPASALAQYLLPRRGRQARTVVIDEDAKEMPPVLLAARLADFDLHARRGPFAGVVDQIADHFLKVLLLAVKFHFAVVPDNDLQPAFSVNLLHGAHDRADHGRDVD